jgi:prophage antirepressor-like protein
MKIVNMFYDEVKNIRMRVIDGETWYVCKDLCRELDKENLLGIPGINYNFEMLYYVLPSESRGILPLGDFQFSQKVFAVNKDGLARFLIILGLKNDNFKDFRDWISKEAQPIICREGTYEDSQKVIDTFKTNLQKKLKED